MAATIDPAVSSPKLAHMPQIDGLRAIAVAAVLLHHFGSGYLATSYGAAATAGVRLFFVLSGFLITGILLIAKDEVTRGTSCWHELKSFYLRRALRIIPLYYLVVLVAVVFDLGSARATVWWLLTYTLNLKMAAQGWYEDLFAHFWTLNVEEQFYIVWPWVVLLVPGRWLMPTTLAVIAATPLWKVAYILSDYSLTTGLGIYIGTWSCLDSLGIGAMAAILRHNGSSLMAPGNRLTLLAAFGCAGIWGMLMRWPSGVTVVLESTVQAIFFAWLILQAAAGFKGPVGAVLRSTPAVFVGRMSYGIYVYHPFVPGALAYVALEGFGAQLPNGWSGLSAAVMATLAVSATSWFLIERPINGLKERFR